MMFLTPQQQLAFHVYVYCNISTDQKAVASLNNVYSNLNFQYFVVNGPQPRQIIEELKKSQQASSEQQAAQSRDKSQLDEQIQYLFDKGFIVRQAKYTSMADKITKSSQLMFKPEKFINQHRSYLKTWKDELEKRGVQNLQQQQQYYCIGGCRSKYYQLYTEEELMEIITQIQYDKIEEIKCPKCGEYGTVRYSQIQNKEQQQDILYPILCELFLQSDVLFKRNQEDNNYLERELQSMRSKYNDFVIKRAGVQNKQNTYINPQIRIEKIRNQYSQQIKNEKNLNNTDYMTEFQQQNNQTSKENIEHDRQYLEYAEAGIDINSINNKSLIVKSERSVVGGVGEYGKVLWVDVIQNKADKTLNQ